MELEKNLMRVLFVRVHSDFGSTNAEDAWVCDFVASLINKDGRFGKTSHFEVGLNCLDIFDGKWKPFLEHLHKNVLNLPI